MKKVLAGAAVGATFLTVFAIWAGVASLRFPWEPLPDFGEVEVGLALPNEATIYAVEPIALDCRARVHATVPLEGRREHSLLGGVYRTDTIEMEAIGDVDTCVEGTSADVVYNNDGTTEVIIPGESIVFVRPRVNAVETADSVTINKGAFGKITDVFPWVDDDLGLTPVSYAYAQNVIGSSECMQAAYSVTQQILIDAYTQQFIESGADPDDLIVRIEGEPAFTDPPPVELDGVELNIAEEGITCVVGDDLLSGDESPESR